MSQEQFICEFCKKEFKNKYNLKSHIERTKKCLVKREQDVEKDYTCSKCEYTTMYKNDLTRHENLCKKNNNALLHEKNKQIEQLSKEIKRLLQEVKEKDDFIKSLASKPTFTTNTMNTTNHNIVNNLQLISEEHLNNQAQHLTIDHIKKGALGYSEYFLEYPLKDRIACTDYSRRKIKYKNDQGEIVTDPEMTVLSDLLFKSIKERNQELAVQYMNELTAKFKTTDDPIQLSYFMEVAKKFSDQDIEVFKMFNGNKNEFFHDIIRNICSKTLV
jgi:hypothetical protein